MLEIKGVMQYYEWGGSHYIPMLLRENATLDLNGDVLPVAELWLGDHPGGSAQLVDGSLLSNWIKMNPKLRLGQKSISRFGERLPYLFKVLDVKQPLSIQVHPTLEQARDGYVQELRLNKPAALRNYKDNNHKPELMLALSDFYLLHGFRSDGDIIDRLNEIKELRPLVSIFKGKGLKSFVSFIFDLAQSELDLIIKPVVERHRSAFIQYELSKHQPLFWFMRAALRSEENGQPYEAGLIMTIILNLIYVPKGGVVFQDAGIPHAYLEGQNIELMANSDNVLRGGLTSKHVDVDELLKVTRFEPVIPEIICPVANDTGGYQYPVPVDDFCLNEYRLERGDTMITPAEEGACIWFVLSGELKLDTQQHFSSPGSAFYQRPGEVNSMVAQSEVIILRASAKVS